MRRLAPIFIKACLWLALALTIASALAGLMSLWKPLTRQTNFPVTWFSVSKTPGVNSCKLPRELLRAKSQGWQLGLWFKGSSVPLVKDLAALQSSLHPAWRVTDKNLYVNQPLLDSLNSTGDASLLVAVDTRESFRQWSRPVLTVAVLLCTLWALSFFSQPVSLPSGAVSGGRMPELDSLRGIAALGVVLFHGATTFFPPEWISIVFDGTGTLQRAPAFAEWIKFSPLAVFFNPEMLVSIFWILSGLVLSAPFIARTDYRRLAQSAAKRYFRLMPLAFFTTLLSFLLLDLGAIWHGDFMAATHFETSLFVVRFAGDPSAAAAFYDALFFGYRFNAPLWTIGLEFWGSLILFGILACTLALKYRRWIWLLIIIYTVMTKQLFFTDFMLGLLLAEFRDGRGGTDLWALQKRGCWSLLIISLVIGSAKSGWLTALAPSAVTIGTFSSHGAALGFVALVALSPAAAQLLRVKPLIWLGERSFALYAVHVLLIASLGYAVVVSVIEMGMSIVPACFTGFAAYLGAALLAAEVLTVLVDKPSVVFAGRMASWLKPSRRSP